MTVVLTLCLGFLAGAGLEERSPIQIGLSGEFASFTNREHPDNRLGYRFHEHTPLIFGDVPQASIERNLEGTTPEIERLKARPEVRVFQRRISEAGWIPQDWTFYLVPVTDGIELALVVKTEAAGLPEFYAVQQCFRLTGLGNEPWRQKYARTAAFSEFDLWKSAPTGVAKTSLTWVIRNGTLQQLPAGPETVGCRTALGATFDTQRSDGHLETLEQVGPYQARMLWTADSGLILRTSLDRKWSTGLYWERSTHLSDHHPADCLHATINIGGIAPHSQRVLHGKIYWLPGPGEKVVKHWRKDFPQ